MEIEWIHIVKTIAICFKILIVLAKIEKSLILKIDIVTTGEPEM
jgi:hypothetical protein